MARNWLAIAKAELLVSTSKFRSARKAGSLVILAIALVWALFIAPFIMSALVDRFAAEIQLLLAFAFPGLMRSIMLLLWIFVLVFPVSFALQEIKIGQWEIMLSNNVSTRDMLFGFFLGKIPSYSLMILFLAPVVITPFVIVYQVSLVGQVLMYSTLIVVALSTLWLSNVLSIAIQAKLGESSRGNDIAKALSMIIAVVIILPLYGLMMFAGPLSEVLGLDVFLVLPSTWGADLITWTAIYFNGIGLPQSSILAFESVLLFGPALDLLLIGVFSIFMIVIGSSAAGRLFRIEAGARTEVVTTIGRDNVFLRGIRILLSGSFGVLIATSLKDFGRKAQNLSRLGYGIFLSILLPLILNFSGQERFTADPLFLRMIITLLMGMVLGMIGGIAFGGIGFLDSKDQLWIFKGAPNGAYKFVRARLASHLLFGIPITLISTTIVTGIMGFGIAEFLIMLLYIYTILSGAILVSTGITAINPAYEDTKSSAFYVNMILTMFIIMIIQIIGLIEGVLIMMVEGNIVLGLLVSCVPLLIVGSIVILIGTKRLSMPDN